MRKIFEYFQIECLVLFIKFLSTAIAGSGSCFPEGSLHLHLLAQFYAFDKLMSISQHVLQFVRPDKTKCPTP